MLLNKIECDVKYNVEYNFEKDLEEVVNIDVPSKGTSSRN